MAKKSTVLSAQSITATQVAIHEKKAVYQSSDIMTMFGISRATVWRWVKNGTLPKPVKFGTRLNVWKPDQIEDFIEKLGAV
jgi:predicted DNA-binding transcriptional regulator AlpA